MIVYTQTKTLYFNTQEALSTYLNKQITDKAITPDLVTSIKMTSSAAEYHVNLDHPAMTQHSVSTMPQLRIGISKE